MSWKDYGITSGDTVKTPNGLGKVKRVSEQGYAHVEIDGQLFETPLAELHKVQEATPVDKPDDNGIYPSVGDKVQKLDNPNSTGKITKVTQRQVTVKWDANGKERTFPKRDINAGKHVIPTEGKPRPEQPKQQEQNQEQQPEKSNHHGEAKKTADSLFGILQLQKHLENKIDESVDEELQEIKELAKQKQKLEVNINGKTTELEGLKHKQLEQLIAYSALRLNPLLVGMAGTGKTHAGEQVSQALSLPFYSMSVGAQTSKSDIIGYMSASGE